MIKKRLFKITLIIIIFSFSGIASAQTDTINQSINDIEEYDIWNQGIIFRIDIGIFIPLDNLKSTLSISPHLALYFGIPVSEKYRIDLGSSIFIPVNSNSIEYILPDTILSGKPILSGTLGIWLTRIDRFNNKYFWDNRIGTGLGFFQTDIPTNKPKEENDNVYSSETIFINIGTGIRRMLFRKRSIGFAVNYFFVPYNAFKQNLHPDFGNQYLTMSISFNF